MRKDDGICDSIESRDSQKLLLNKTNSIAKQVDSQIHEIKEEYDEDSEKKINTLKDNTKLSIFQQSTVVQEPVDYTLNEKGVLVPIYHKKIKLEEYDFSNWKQQEQLFNIKINNIKNLNEFKQKSEPF